MVVSLPAFAPTHMGNLYFLRSGCSILCCGLKYLITQADKPEILSQQIICWALALAPVSFAAMIGIFRESRVCISKFKVLQLYLQHRLWCKTDALCRKLLLCAEQLGLSFKVLHIHQVLSLALCMQTQEHKQQHTVKLYEALFLQIFIILEYLFFLFYLLSPTRTSAEFLFCTTAPLPALSSTQPFFPWHAASPGSPLCSG